MKTNLRMTPQTLAVLNSARQLGHGSNQDILNIVRNQFPKLTATTVHRITLRLINNQILARGPEINGVQLVDANTRAHDHFVCSGCQGVKDVTISEPIKKKLLAEINIEVNPSNLVIHGDCSSCL